MMKKRWLCLAAAMMMTASFLAGCSMDSEDSGSAGGAESTEESSGESTGGDEILR